MFFQNHPYGYSLRYNEQRTFFNVHSINSSLRILSKKKQVTSLKYNKTNLSVNINTDETQKVCGKKELRFPDQVK